MNPILVVNDLHAGVQRAAGTTPASAAALRQYLQDSFRTLILNHQNKDVLILGDLFDSFWIDPKDLMETYETLSEWLECSRNNMYLVAGNHDHSAKGDKVSSFNFLCRMLAGRFEDRVGVIDATTGGQTIHDRIHVIPHMPNQDLFELELEKSLTKAQGLLLLHCNYINNFADKSDHSLNVTDTWAYKLTAKHRLMIAHEHQGRDLNHGLGVTIIGNQFPSSVSDCLSHGSAQQDGLKRAIVIKPDLGYDEITTWDAFSEYTPVDWQELDQPIVGTVKFIRVTGTATAAQAAEVVSAIAKFRAVSSAFVITNAVKVDGMEGVDQLAETNFREVKSFDVLSALLDLLDADEAKAVKELLEDEA